MKDLAISRNILPCADAQHRQGSRSFSFHEISDIRTWGRGARDNGRGLVYPSLASSFALMREGALPWSASASCAGAHRTSMRKEGP